MQSIWKASCRLPEREGLQGNRKTDVTVIGGGMTGILTAFFLQKKGARVLVLEGNGFIEALRFRALENQYRSAASQAVAAAQMLPDQTYAKLENTAAAHSLALKGTLFYHKTLEEIDIYFQIEETFFQSSGFLYVQSTPPGKKDLSLSYDEIHWIADDWAYVNLY